MLNLVDEAEFTFNSITVDGDTSTSDTLLLFATQKVAHVVVRVQNDPMLSEFRQALHEVLEDLAVQLIRDGEGATKLVSVIFRGQNQINLQKRSLLRWQILPS